MNGIFLSNCPFHVSVLKEFAWGDMDVLLADREGSEVLKNVVKNWLEMTEPYQAMDLPTQQNGRLAVFRLFTLVARPRWPLKRSLA